MLSPPSISDLRIFYQSVNQLNGKYVSYLYWYIICYIMSFIWMVAGDRFVDFHRLKVEGKIHTGLLLRPFCRGTLNIMGNWVQLRISPREQYQLAKTEIWRFDLCAFSCLFPWIWHREVRIKEKSIIFLSWIRVCTAGPNEQTNLFCWAGLIQIQPMTVSI